MFHNHTRTFVETGFASLNQIRTFVENGFASLNAASIRSVSSPSREGGVMDQLGSGKSEVVLTLFTVDDGKLESFDGVSRG